MENTPDSNRRDLDRHETSIKYLTETMTGLITSNELLKASLTSFDQSMKEIKEIIGKIAQSLTTIGAKQDEGIEKRLEMVESSIKEINNKINTPVDIKLHVRRWWWLYSGCGLILTIALIRNVPQELWPHIITSVTRIEKILNTPDPNISQ